MTPEQFTYWLQGYFEISGSKMLSSKQTQIIMDHLALVFTKATPDRNKEVSSDLDETKEKGLLLDSIIPGEAFPRDSKSWDLDNQPLCSPAPLDSNRPICETAQKIGLGKYNLKKTRVYC